MNPLEDKLRSATAETLRGWTDPRMVERGEGYLENVLEIADAGDEGVFSSVRGTADYFTRVFLDDDGELESECSCPVYYRCKHAVATILKCAQRLSADEPAWTKPADGTLLENAREAIAAGTLRWQEWQKNAAPPRKSQASPPGGDAGDAQAPEWDDSGARNAWAAYRAELDAAREDVLAACNQGERGKIHAAIDRFLRCKIPYESPPDWEQIPLADATVDSTMETAIGALRKTGMDETDLILWAIKLDDPEHSLIYDKLGNPVYELGSPPEEKSPGAEVWRRVAGGIEAWIGELCAADGKDVRQPQLRYMLDALRKAWARAGDETRAADVWLRHAARAGYWKETAEFLNLAGRHDDAMQVARDGIRGAASSEYGNDYRRELMEPLADAFSGKGDHLKAAAILAEQFLSWMGAYEFHRTIASFNKLLDEAARAGVREELRAAIIHALKTGINPVPLQDHVFRPPAPNPWWPVATKVEYAAPDALPEAPPWPLPRSGEAVYPFSDSRWGTQWTWCQYDQEFLLKLALENGDPEEVALRFCNLPAYPTSSALYSRNVPPMLRAVREKMLDLRPDIVEAIDTPRLHWTKIKNRPPFASTPPANPPPPTE